MEIILNDRQNAWKTALCGCMTKRKTTRQISLDFGVTQRCVEYKLAAYKKYGDKSLIHGNKGRRHLSIRYENLRREIIRIFLSTKMQDRSLDGISYSYFRQLLDEYFGLKASESFVKKTLRSIGYQSPRHGKRNKPAVHLTRHRRERKGELVQIDGSYHDWFRCGHKTCIHGFIDDASGEIVSAYMTKHECSFGYHEGFRAMARAYGLPLALYTDKASLFYTTRHSGAKTPPTQFHRIMTEFGVELIPASTPQAKGRVERMWQTLQGQLPFWFWLHGIKTIDEANEALPRYIRTFNKRYAKTQKESVWVPVSDSQLDRHLKLVTIAKTDRGGVFSLKGYLFQCPEMVNRKVKVCMSRKDGLWCEPLEESKRLSVHLVETDDTGGMPEVWKELVDEFFLKNVKAKYREVYKELDYLPPASNQ